MTFESNRNYQYQFMSNQYDGQYHAVYKDNNGDYFVEIDGKKVKLDKVSVWNSKATTDLADTPERLVNYYDKLLKKNEEKKEYLEAMANSIKKNLKLAKNKYYSFLASIGVSKFSDISDEGQKIQAKELKASVSGLESQKISNSNSYFSACMRSFDYALEKGDWQNQLSLAKSIS